MRALNLEIARINGSKIFLYWWLETARSGDNERTNKIFNNTKNKIKIMAIKVIAQLREVKLGKNPGKKFVMRPDLYVPITDSDCTGCHVLYGTVK